jgi:cbb3-type cytochrome oxidase maturation protein
MGVIVILILISLTFALLFLGGFIWAVKSGQFEDTCTPAMRILAEDEKGNKLSGAQSAPRPNCSNLTPQSLTHHQTE